MRSIGLKRGLLTGVSIGGFLAAGGGALAQADKAADPVAAATESPADKPITVTQDPEFQSIMQMLTGSFLAPAKVVDGQELVPALWFNAAPVAVQGLDNAAYFEITRADAPFVIVRQGVLTLLRLRDSAHLRVLGFRGQAGTGSAGDGGAGGGGGGGAALVGLWAEPSVFPAFNVSDFTVEMDLLLKKSGDGYAGESEHAYPVMRDGAVEARSKISITSGSVRFEDLGTNAFGDKAWGMEGPGAPTFVRATSPVTASKSENGLVVVTLAPALADAPKLAEGGKVVVHYAGYFADGRQFDTSRQMGREPIDMRIPGPVIKGWNEGLLGIAKGERRRLVIPPDLGYGVRGRPPVIPANSSLYFDLECLYVDNTPAPPVQPTPPPPPPATPPVRPSP